MASLSTVIVRRFSVHVSMTILLYGVTVKNLCIVGARDSERAK